MLFCIGGADADTEHYSLRFRGDCLKDALIDGPFIMAKKSLEIKFRGSTNQRIIDVQESLMQGHVVLHQIQLDEMKVRPDLVMA